MTEDQIIALSVGIIVLIYAGILFWYFKYQYPKDKEKARIRQQEKEEEYRKAFETEPEYVFKQAKITGMRKYVYDKMDFSMPMLPKRVDEYYVTFLNEDGEEKEYLVSEEFFYNVTKDEKGTLITVNGNFFDFGDGIDVVAEEETEENIEE